MMNFRDLVRLLGDGEYRSGEELGERLGVSRTAIWKQLKKLEGLGVTLEAVRGRGYRVSPPIELLDGSEIVGKLPHAARRRLARLFVEMQLDSTNSFLLNRFSQGAGHAEVCFAEQQTSGRGRRGRRWETPLGGGLTFSLGWRFDSPAAHLQGLSLSVGVVIAQALASQGVDIELKWPNDLLLRRGDGELAKLGGVLIELQGDAEGPCEVVIGIGLNVLCAPKLEGGKGLPSGCLGEVNRGLSRNAVAAVLIEHLTAMLERFGSEGFEPWRSRWNQLHALSGCAVNVTLGEGGYLATALDVDSNGNLRVREGDTIRTLAGGEITLRPLSD